MTIPIAPTESGGSKLAFTTYDSSGTNKAAILRGIAEETINSEVLAHLAVATHGDDETYAVGDPVVLAAGINGTDIVALKVDSGGIVSVSGAVTDSGWDNAGKSVQRGLSQGNTGTTETVLLTADAANIYNITDLVLTVYSGSTAPAAMRTIKFRLNTAGTVFHTVYVPPTADQVYHVPIQFKEPVRTALNQTVTVQLSAAMGTAAEYSAMVLAFKTTS